MSRIKSLLKREEWLHHVSTWSVSGLTQAAYCRERTLNATTFNGWVLRQKAESSAAAPLTCVPVVIQSDTSIDLSTVMTESPIILQHSSGWQLALSSNVQITWLARLLKGLA